MALGEHSPSPTLRESASAEEVIAYYKSQYEQLEQELSEFQASSRELEAELEKDIEASEKRERKLQEKLERVGFEVEEWKTKYKQCKAEASTVQNTLQKEITQLRDAHRTTQLKLRDIEVANDDIERQARNTTSSLEDLESKYNVAIERAVLLEAEVHVGEQEREALRIENQRLRDELSDLRIEAEITQEKVRRLESAVTHRNRASHPLPIGTPVGNLRVQSETSPVSTASSPTRISPPPFKSTSTSVSDTPTPPSPPPSETSINTALNMMTPTLTNKSRIPNVDHNFAARPSLPPSRLQRPSIGAAGNYRSAANGRNSGQPGTLPSSGSLRHIRGLIGQVQRLEQRVHSARSKLPGPSATAATPPNRSPYSRTAFGNSGIPASVTVRSHKKRSGGAGGGGGHGGSNNVGELLESTDDVSTPLHTRRLSRVSSTVQRSSRDESRPCSRADLSGAQGAGHALYGRPASRASISGSRTSHGYHAGAAPAEGGRRPQSSLAGQYAAHHGHSASIGGVDGVSGGGGSAADDVPFAFATPTPRRSTFNRHDLTTTATTTPSAIPTPSASSIRRPSAGGSRIAEPSPLMYRSSTARPEKERERERDRAMGPPERRRRPLSGLGDLRL